MKVYLFFLVALFSQYVSAADNPVVIFKTTMGDIHIETFPEKAPITVKNFLQYVDDGFYNDVIFHRVIPGFVIQGGGFDETMMKRPVRATIKNESNNGLKNERGTLSMARLNAPDSATSQFFINLVDNKNLDASRSKLGYAVFANVIQGIEVVDVIAKTKTGRKAGHAGVPLSPVMIISATYLSTEPKTDEELAEE